MRIKILATSGLAKMELLLTPVVVIFTDYVAHDTGGLAIADTNDLGLGLGKRAERRECSLARRVGHAECHAHRVIAGAGLVRGRAECRQLFDGPRARQDQPHAEFRQAIIDHMLGNKVRFKPILLTALAAMIGAATILLDPIFQGLAIAMMCGEIASTLLSRVTIPILYFLVQGWKERHHIGQHDAAEETA